jgi:tetratricopeptide (TPR) repeat protein
MNSALQRTPPNEVEDRAWILTQMGHLLILDGKLEVADKVLARALEMFPDYHYALANLAKVRQEQNKHAEAAELLRKRHELAPHPENLFDLAVALERAGKNEEAQASFAEFEKSARKEMNGWDNANRELIAYYADHAGKPEEALRIARREVERRRDVHTLDAYAWALHKSGDHAEARKQIGIALAVGVKDPKIVGHAEEIRRSETAGKPGRGVVSGGN